MKVRPTLEEAKRIMAEGDYGGIPISTEIYSDSTTPIEGAAQTESRQQACLFAGKRRGRQKMGTIFFSGL